MVRRLAVLCEQVSRRAARCCGRPARARGAWLAAEGRAQLLLPVRIHRPRRTLTMSRPLTNGRNCILPLDRLCGRRRPLSWAVKRLLKSAGSTPLVVDTARPRTRAGSPAPAERLYRWATFGVLAASLAIVLATFPAYRVTLSQHYPDTYGKDLLAY